ncbi:MAG: phosphoribosylanthranilate isomerase [Candidatus Sulfotelmatobacter sp.]|jgi:phosphoribosylanthranilate isomerase
MTWIKICGMTNLEDALVAVEAGADAVGFVFYEKSPRNISVEGARDIVEKLPEQIEKIGVFVGHKNANPLKVFLDAALSGMQIYDQPEDGFLQVGMIGHHDRFMRARFLRPLAMSLIAKNQGEIKELASSFAGLRKHWKNGVRPSEQEMATVLLDSGDLLQPGGTGKTFDWKQAVPIAEGMCEGGLKLVVAGGLTAENVTEAIEVLKPWGVDVASGVEARPGKKDPEKVRAFVKAVRDADRKAS